MLRYDMKGTFKKALLFLLLACMLVLLTGCGNVEQALREVGRAYESDVETPVSPAGDVDWSYVPLLRERSQKLFTEAAPEAEILETAVASKNGSGDRVVVVIEFRLNGKEGKYGFDYKRASGGEYELSRYGEGVSVDDL